MADVRDILGVSRGAAPQKAPEGKPKAAKPRKPKGMSREVYNLVGDAGLVPMVRHWVLRGIKSSARADSLELKHWEHAGLRFPDYPYARFNRKVTVIRYTDEEFQKVRDNGWTKEETHLLFDLCERYDLRWPVIADRCRTRGMARSLEDLKERFFTVTAAVLDLRGNRATDPDPFVSGMLQFRYDRQHEERRRTQLDRLLRRAPSEELEEERLVREQRRIDAELKRLHKELKQRANNGLSAVDGVPMWPASRASYEQYLVAAAPGASGSGALQAVDAGAPALTRGGMYLRSRRFKPPPPVGEGGVLSAKVLEKISLVLAELGVPEQPVATAAVLDAYDKLRQDILKMLSLKKHLSKQRALLIQVVESRTLVGTETAARHPNLLSPPTPASYRVDAGGGDPRRSAKRAAPSVQAQAAKRSRK